MIHDYNSAVARFDGDKSMPKGRINAEVLRLNFGNTHDYKPTLTIGVPVFNGQSSIRKTLISIYNSLQNLKNQELVELVICDNASTDLTTKIIQEFFAERKMAGSYFRHGQNLGFDSNLDSIVKFSTGKYVWLVGCDDEVKSDALSRLLEKLHDLDVENILLDFDRFSEADDIFLKKKEHKGLDDVTAKGRNNFSYPRYAPALSANIVNREKWLSCMGRAFKVSGWGHVERILQVVSSHESSETRIFAGPYFTLFVDKNGWWTKPDGYKLHLAHIRVIQGMEELGFASSAKNNRLKEIDGLVLVRSLIGARKYGYKFSEDDLKEIRANCTQYTYRLAVVGLYIPLHLASFAFTENKSQAMRLGFRRILKRIYDKNKCKDIG